MTGSKSVVCSHDWFAGSARKWLPRATGLLAALSVLIAPSIAHADDISYLGPLAQAFPTMYEPLVLKAAKPASPTKGKVQFTLFDTPWDNSSAATRWPLVKVLDQFGTWTGLVPGAALGIEYPAWNAVPGCSGMPTYDLTVARYSSKYVTFVHRIVQSKKNGPHARLSAAEQVLFNNILRMPTYTMAGNGTQSGVLTPYGYSGLFNTVFDLPAVAIGRYGVHRPGMTILCSHRPDKASAFDEIRQRLIQPAAGDSGMVHNMNVYTNTLVAGICKQDGLRPPSVCNLRAVKYILTRLK
jgi:hypothetical protein